MLDVDHGAAHLNVAVVEAVAVERTRTPDHGAPRDLGAHDINGVAVQRHIELTLLGLAQVDQGGDDLMQGGVGRRAPYAEPGVVQAPDTGQCATARHHIELADQNLQHLPEQRQGSEQILRQCLRIGGGLRRRLHGRRRDGHEQVHRRLLAGRHAAGHVVRHAKGGRRARCREGGGDTRGDGDKGGRIAAVASGRMQVQRLRGQQIVHQRLAGRRAAQAGVACIVDRQQRRDQRRPIAGAIAEAGGGGRDGLVEVLGLAAHAGRRREGPVQRTGQVEYGHPVLQGAGLRQHLAGQRGIVGIADGASGRHGRQQAGVGHHQHGGAARGVGHIQPGSEVAAPDGPGAVPVSADRNDVACTATVRKKQLHGRVQIKARQRIRSLASAGNQIMAGGRCQRFAVAGHRDRRRLKIVQGGDARLHGALSVVAAAEIADIFGHGAKRDCLQMQRLAAGRVRCGGRIADKHGQGGLHPDH